MEPQNDAVSLFMCYCAVIVVVKRFPVLTLMSPARMLFLLGVLVCVPMRAEVDCVLSDSVSLC